jgi:hypothetical protein
MVLMLVASSSLVWSSCFRSFHCFVSAGTNRLATNNSAIQRINLGACDLKIDFVSLAAFAAATPVLSVTKTSVAVDADAAGCARDLAGRGVLENARCTCANVRFSRAFQSGPSEQALTPR